MLSSGRTLDVPPINQQPPSAASRKRLPSWAGGERAVEGFRTLKNSIEGIFSHGKGRPPALPLMEGITLFQQDEAPHV